MAKVLVLDDDLTRHKKFKQKLIGNEVIHVTNAEEAIFYLKNEEVFDVVFLDHDLGGKQNVISGKETGYEVACWIRDNPEKRPNQIVIHSFNPVGAKNMMEVLPGSIYVPGIWNR